MQNLAARRKSGGFRVACDPSMPLAAAAKVADIVLMLFIVGYVLVKVIILLESQGIGTPARGNLEQFVAKKARNATESRLACASK